MERRILTVLKEWKQALDLGEQNTRELRRFLNRTRDRLRSR